MACHLFGPKPLFEPLWYCQLDPQEQTSVKFEQDNKFENIVHKITSFLSQPQYINSEAPNH